MSDLPIFYIEEPNLVFGYEKRCPDPKLGLSTYGPYRNKEDESEIDSIRLALIGERQVVQKMKEFIEKSKNFGFDGSEDKPKEWASMPKISRETSWNLSVKTPEDPYVETLNNREIAEIYQTKNDGLRISKMSDLIEKKISKIKDQCDPEPDVILIGITPSMNKNVGLAVSKEDITIEQSFDIEKDASQEALTEFVEQAKSQEEVEEKALDLRASIKAKTMEYGVPTQILQQDNLENILNGSGNEHPSKKAWNIWTALYYKSGAYPYRLPQEDQETCFVGIKFYEEEKVPEKPLKTAMAQVYSPTGNTIVIKGLPVEEQNDSKSPKMSEKGIEKLLSRVKRSYKKNAGNLPNRLVFHKSSKFSEQEKESIIDNLGGIESYDLISFKNNPEERVFRKNKQEQVLRGTGVKLSEDEVLLYTTGWKPYYETYDGQRIPRPILVRHQGGDTPIDEICKEILQLTKVNYNNAKFSQREPFTLLFAQKSGDVFKEMNPDQVDPEQVQSKYRFYM